MNLRLKMSFRLRVELLCRWEESLVKLEYFAGPNVKSPIGVRSLERRRHDWRCTWGFQFDAFFLPSSRASSEWWRKFVEARGQGVQSIVSMSHLIFCLDLEARMKTVIFLWSQNWCRCRKFVVGVFVRPSSWASCRWWRGRECAREYRGPTRRVARWWPRSWGRRTSSEPSRLLSELDLGFLWWLPIRSIQIAIYGIYLKTIPSHKKLKWVFISNYFGDRFRVDAENLGLPLSFGLRVQLLVGFEGCSSVLESVACPDVESFIGGHGLEGDARPLSRVDRGPNLCAGFSDDSRDQNVDANFEIRS